MSLNEQNIEALVDPIDPLPGNALVEAFNRDGFLPPVRVMTAAQCALLVRHLRSAEKPKPIEWDKGEAAADRLVFDIATSPQVLTWLRTLVGNDIALWGASLAQRAPTQRHPWHTDIESSDPKGGFVSVWIGLEYTSRELWSFACSEFAPVWADITGCPTNPRAPEGRGGSR